MILQCIGTPYYALESIGVVVIIAGLVAGDGTWRQRRRFSGGRIIVSYVGSIAGGVVVLVVVVVVVTAVAVVIIGVLVIVAQWTRDVVAEPEKGRPS